MKSKNLKVYSVKVFYNRVSDLKILQKVMNSRPGQSKKDFLKELKEWQYFLTLKEAKLHRIECIKKRIANAEHAIQLNINNIVNIRREIYNNKKHLKKHS